MHPNRTRRPYTGAAIGLGGIVLALAVSGCASTTTAEVDAAPEVTGLAADLPEETLAAGEITNLIQSPNPPMEMGESDDLTGVTIELVEALSDAIGFPITTTAVSDFDQLFPSVQTGRTDMVMSSVKDLADRHDRMAFVDYFRTGNQFWGFSDTVEGFDIDDLCGQTVISFAGSDLPESAQTEADVVCGAAGKPSVTLLNVTTIADSVVQLEQGRAVAVLSGIEAIGYLQTQNPGVYSTIGDPFDQTVYGVAIAPDRVDTLGEVLRAGFDQMIADGTYAEILDRWNLSVAAMDAATINTPLQ